MKKENIKPSVLLVEDDQAIATMVIYNLEKQGFEVRTTDDGEEALIMVDEQKPDVVLLDWMLPGLSGIQITDRLRKKEETKKIPIIIISARDQEGDKIEGLDRGADDYITKPFSPRELISRINAVFRRIRPAFVAKKLNFGPIYMDLVTKIVTINERNIHLAPIEYKLLQSLLEYPQRVLSRQQLIRRAWGNTDVEPRTVDVHINRLRNSLNLKDDGVTIKTMRSSGYCLKYENDNESQLLKVNDSDISDITENSEYY